MEQFEISGTSVVERERGSGVQVKLVSLHVAIVGGT
jgi:hypothetical protein